MVDLKVLHMVVYTIQDHDHKRKISVSGALLFVVVYCLFIHVYPSGIQYKLVAAESRTVTWRGLGRSKLIINCLLPCSSSSGFSNLTFPNSTRQIQSVTKVLKELNDGER